MDTAEECFAVTWEVSEIDFGQSMSVDLDVCWNHAPKIRLAEYSSKTDNRFGKSVKDVPACADRMMGMGKLPGLDAQHGDLFLPSALLTHVGYNTGS